LKKTIKLGWSFTLLLLLIAIPSKPAFAQNRDVILTTDCGAEIDDQFAIAYLSLIPQIHIKAIVTTHAPTLPKQAETSADCVKDVLRRLAAGTSPPVFAGSDVALATRAPLGNDGVDFIVKTARDYSSQNRLLIITLGATTDVASAFLTDSKFGDRVEILTMGFDSWPKGGDPWNIKNDPLAYQIILGSSAPITIGSTDVTRKYLELSDTEAAQMLSGHGPFAEWLNGLFQHWVTTQSELVAQVVRPRHWVIWDTVVAAHLLGFTTEVTHPRPALNLADLSFSFPKTEKTVRWITAIDSKKMWPDFVQRLDRANAQRAAKPHFNPGSN
jgi:purine nucleosidase